MQRRRDGYCKLAHWWDKEDESRVSINKMACAAEGTGREKKYMHLEDTKFGKFVRDSVSKMKEVANTTL